MPTKQIEFWRSEFGTKYMERSGNAITPEGTRRLMRDWGRILNHAVTPYPSSALEVGCNIGRNLVVLSRFIQHLSGIDPSSEAVSAARANELLADVDIREGHGLSLPYEDSSFDLVFTSGVLIHVAPEELGRVVDEIVRVSRKYIICIEYFSHEPTEVEYHGRKGVLFKRDFGRFYFERYPNFRVLDYGFLWQPIDSSDNSNWWLFAKD